MLLTPRLGNLGGLLECGAHRSAPFPIWIEPDWEFDGLLHHSAGAIVRFLYLVFDAQRLTGQFTDRYQRAPAQFTAERWFTAVFAVTQHTDMKVVVNRVGLGATDSHRGVTESRAANASSPLGWLHRGRRVSEGEIMRLCGWETRSMFDRYNIIDATDLDAAVAKRCNGTVAARSAAPAADVDSLTSSPSRS